LVALAHAAQRQQHFSAPRVPGGRKTSRPSSLFPVRLNIPVPREDVAKMKELLVKAMLYRPSQPTKLEVSESGFEKHQRAL
jgi:hypothetical protein